MCVRLQYSDTHDWTQRIEKELKMCAARDARDATLKALKEGSISEWDDPARRKLVPPWGRDESGCVQFEPRAYQEQIVKEQKTFAKREARETLLKTLKEARRTGTSFNMTGSLSGDYGQSLAVPVRLNDGPNPSLPRSQSTPSLRASVLEETSAMDASLSSSRTNEYSSGARRHARPVMVAQPTLSNSKSSGVLRRVGMRWTQGVEHNNAWK